MPKLPFPKVVSYGEKDTEKLAIALRELHDYVRRQPTVEVFERIGEVVFPMAIVPQMETPRSVTVNASVHPDDESVVALAGMHWVYDAKRGEISITSIGGVTAGTDYKLTFVVVGER